MYKSQIGTEPVCIMP